jgi:hypothetical protein
VSFYLEQTSLGLECLYVSSGLVCQMGGFVYVVKIN